MKTKSTSRRNFLVAAGIGGAGAVAAVATSRKPKVAGERIAEADRSSGYRVSEHILKYYKTTEV
jgi:hypothetical protein